MTIGAKPVPRLFFGARDGLDTIEQGNRTLPEERAVALSFNGTTFPRR